MLKEQELPDRWSAKGKSEIVPRFLRSEDLGELSNPFEVSAFDGLFPSPSLNRPQYVVVWLRAKRWLLGTFQRGVSNDHLFHRLLEQAVQTDHTPIHALFLGAARGKRAGVGRA
jgi:hypothetical protein